MKRLVQPFFASLLAAGVFAAAPAAAQFEEAGVRSFLAADQNRDELLNLSEFRAFIQNLAAEGAPQSVRIRRFMAYRIAFGRVDRNGDGFATPEELRAAEAQS